MRYQNLRALSASKRLLQKIVKALKKEGVKLPPQTLKQLMEKLDPSINYTIEITQDPDKAAETLILRNAMGAYEAEEVTALAQSNCRRTDFFNMLCDAQTTIVGEPKFVVADGCVYDCKFYAGEWNSSLDRAVSDGVDHLAEVDFEVDFVFIAIISTLIGQILGESDDWGAIENKIVIYVPREQDHLSDEVYRKQQKIEMEKLYNMELE